MLNVKIEKEGKVIAVISAVSENDGQFKIEEQISIRGRVSAVKEYGIVAHNPADGDRLLALKMLQKITEKK